MAALPEPIKVFVTQALACFDTPSRAAKSVMEEFGVTVSPQQCERYDPTKRAGSTLSKKYREIFERTREEFLKDTSRIGVSHRAVRLRALDRAVGIAEPLVEYTWSRDVHIRTDVSAADELASFTNSAFGMSGGINPNGLNWISNEGNALAGPSVDVGKTAQPLLLWGAEVKYTVPELVKSQQLGTPIDAQKVEAMNLKRNMDLDQIVYYGDPLMNFTGLVNSTSAVGSVTNVPNGAAGTPQWNTKTPDEILKDVNEILTSAWQASGWKVKPNKLMLPPAVLGSLLSRIISNAGSKSILAYLIENNICRQLGTPLEFLELKWLIGAGAGGTQGQLNTVDRMVAYNSDKKYVQFPMTDLQRTPLEYRSLYQITTYWSRIGRIEWRYGTTAAYRDGI